MLDDVEGAAEGNEAVCDWLQFWLDEAKKGELIFCAGVFSRSPTDVRVGRAGVIGTEFAIYYGLDDLKRAISDGIEERKSPQPALNGPANRFMYNLVQLSCSFDFMCWLLQAEMVRVREGAPPPLRVGFYLGKTGDLENALNTKQRQQNYHGIMLPLIEMLGGVVDQTAIDGRHVQQLSLAPVMAAHARGEQIPTFQVPAQAQTEINDAVMEACGKRPVTITLREADHFPHRNSNLPEWLKFAQWLQRRGEAVLFVRDTAKATEPLPGFNCCPPASLNLMARLALYNQARANLFVSNGPNAFAVLGERPYLIFQQITPDSNYWGEQAEGWRFFTGVEPGGQWPIAKQNQRIVWQKDTFENIRDAWLEHIEGNVLQAAAS